MLVGTNIAGAFSLAGAFSIIRFRSAEGDPKEISYVLICMAVGLASGMGFPLHALIIATVSSTAMVILERSGFASPNDFSRILRITVAESLNHHDAFDAILDRYATSSRLVRIRTTELGSLVVLDFELLLKPGMDEREFVDEVRTKNGNLSISLTRTGL